MLPESVPPNLAGAEAPAARKTAAMRIWLRLTLRCERQPREVVVETLRDRSGNEPDRLNPDLWATGQQDDLRNGPVPRAMLNL